MVILVTGAAGFVGMHVCKRLLEQGYTVVGLDNLNDYYDVNLKNSRLVQLSDKKRFVFEKINICDQDGLPKLFSRYKFSKVVHLAAQVGVRYSLINPVAYADTNLSGFLNVLEVCRKNSVEHMLYASSSSVYGGNTKIPYSEDDSVDQPVSLYAATKKANELMAHSYSHMYGLHTTGLRFFTVYGPWGRPDMSPMIFAKAILEGSPIDVFNHGNMQRDFTYIDDVVESVVRILDLPFDTQKDKHIVKQDGSNGSVPWRLFNIGNNNPVKLLEYIKIIESIVGKNAVIQYMPMQIGDVLTTYADTKKLLESINFAPSTDLTTGLSVLVEWMRNYYKYS
jgi:UDP-glucuronate 4-epimerase